MAACEPSFFGRYALPVFDSLSASSRLAIEQLLASGASARREHQWLEFFKSVDWLSLEELTLLTTSPARKLPVTAQMRLFQDLKAYYQQKEETRQRQRLQRQARHRRLIAYYREKIPAADKRLLEQLRDYELALTARDVNWQYYFALRSLKRIDAFLAEPPATRLARIAQFKADVLAYKRNLDLRRWSREEPYLTFDAWCQAHGVEDFEHDTTSQHQRRERARGSEQPSTRTASPSPDDYALLRVPPGTPMSAVKRQFRKLALTAHPDITGDDGDTMRRLLDAYERIRTQASCR